MRPKGTVSDRRMYPTLTLARQARLVGMCIVQHLPWWLLHVSSVGLSVSTSIRPLGLSLSPSRSRRRHLLLTYAYCTQFDKYSTVMATHAHRPSWKC
jgi:hypothetical protein